MRCILRRMLRVMEAALDHLPPGNDEDIENLPLSRPDSGRIDQRQMTDRTWLHDGHLGGNPTTQASSHQVHLIQACFLEEPVVKDGLMRHGRQPVRTLRMTVARV